MTFMHRIMNPICWGWLVVVLLGHAIAPTTHADFTEIDWARETILLPPGFAPDFPSGIEELRFAPGWRDPASENFWSYAIVLRIDEAVPSTARLEELVAIYYTGLMDAFGVGRGSDALPNEVEVDLRAIDATRHRGTMELVDGFATFARMKIRLQVETRPHGDAASILEFRVSAQDFDHAVWEDLDAAVDHMNDAPLAALSHLPYGEWRTTPANGNEQRDVWSWGPGRHALTSITTNRGSKIEAIFGFFTVIYRHPSRDDFSVLALSGPGLVQIGTMRVVDGVDLRFDMKLFYDQQEIEWALRPTREITSVWSFDDFTRYTNAWVEDDGIPVDPGSVAWPYRKYEQITPRPASSTAGPDDVRHLAPLLPLVASAWESESSRTTFEWIPYNEAVLMRTHDAQETLVAEAIFYPHPLTKTIRVLTIHASGAVDEGTVQFDGESIRILAMRARDDATTSIETRIDTIDAAALRWRTWSVGGDARRLIDDAVLRAVRE